MIENVNVNIMEGSLKSLIKNLGTNYSYIFSRILRSSVHSFCN